MFHTSAFPIIDPFAAGQAAQGRGIPISQNPFPPGTRGYTQWILGYQWGSDAVGPQSGLGSRLVRLFRWVVKLFG
jgi:hypothetical protein